MATLNTNNKLFMFIWMIAGCFVAYWIILFAYEIVQTIPNILDKIVFIILFLILSFLTRFWVIFIFWGPLLWYMILQSFFMDNKKE